MCIAFFNCIQHVIRFMSLNLFVKLIAMHLPAPLQGFHCLIQHAA